MVREFFYPKSVAVIGVSDKPTNLGRNIVRNLVEYSFTGVVYAVGPSGGTIETRRIYPSVADIPDEVDLAVILTPAKTVPGYLEACGQKGIHRVIIETAGFREYGEQGRVLEDEMLQIAEKYGIRFIGPNCLGAINMENGFCVPFATLKKFIKKGDVSMIAQSGGVGLSVLNLMANEGIGLNKFVSVGNMLNVSAEDLLEYLIEDDGTRLIFLYLETIKDGRRLMELARRSTKPIITFKANIGKLSRNIAASHTASLSSDDRVVDAAFQQSGIIRTRDATSLGNILKILELPPMRGKNLAVISRSGGHAVIAADACELSGFRLASFPEAFLKDVEQFFRASVIRLTNPLDLGDIFNWEAYARIVEQTLQLPGVDGVVFLHTSVSETEHLGSRALLERLVKMVKQYDKPVAYYLSVEAAEINYLKQNYNFPIFTQVVETIRALEMSYRYCCEFQRAQELELPHQISGNRDAVCAILDNARAEKRDLLLTEAIEVMKQYGIPTVSGEFARTAVEAQAAAERVGFPIVMKVVAGQISHKSDVGGVELNLQDLPAVAAAFDNITARIRQAQPGTRIEGVIVQAMAPAGVELILGGRQDEQFGPVVLVGLGGIFVELFDQAAVRVTPVSEQDALDMINSLQGAQILYGARGRKPVDVPSVVEALQRLGQLLTDFPEIREVDINPLVVFPEKEGCLALDARLIL